METLLYTLKSAVVLSFFYMVYTALLKKETLFIVNRRFLLIGILTAALFPFLEFTKTVLLEVPAFEASQISGITAQSTGQANFSGVQDNTFFSFEKILIFIYATGVLALLIRFFYQLSVLTLLLKKYPVQKMNGYKLIKVPEAISPFSFFNYLVYNPEMHTEEELAMILKHEKVHIQQQHSMDILISNILIIVQWFNPLAWLYKKSIEENLEFIADHNTAKQVYSKKEYQLSLVKASSATLLPALTNYFYKSFIKKRIIMLNKTNSKKRNALKAMIVLPLLAIFLWSFNVKEVTKFVEKPSKKNKVEATTPEQPIPEAVFNGTKAANKAMSSKKIEAHIKKSTTSEKREAPVKDKFRVNINKNTTDSKLKEIKEDLKTNYGIDLNYSASRNSDNEIISLSMSYTGNGNNGNYQVTDDDGIDEFFFFIDDEGKTGFWSEATEKRREEHLEKRKMMMEERQEEMEKHLEERNIEIDKRREEMEERRKDMRDKITAEEIVIEKNQHVLKDRQKNVEYVVARSGKGSNGVTVISGSSDAVMINKNTTDAELAKLKKDLAAKNIDFTYKGVKRNKAGEITSLRISMDDNKGSKSSTVINTDDGEPIEQVIIHQ